MRLLFIPYPSGISHIHSLVALAKKLNPSRYEIAFLLCKELHHLGKILGFPVLDIDHGTVAGSFRSELLAYQRFRPDIVIDDTSVTTLFVSHITNTPRIAIQRTGMFPAEIPRHKTLQHSLGKGFDKKNYEFFHRFNIPVPTRFSDLFEAEIKIIPGIEEIEVLPRMQKNNSTYIYAGPLIIEDFICEWDKSKTHFIIKNEFASLEKFFRSNKHRYITYFTFGNIAQANNKIFESLRFLIDNAIAVVTNIDVGEIKQNQQELYFYRPYLPMHTICSRVDLMVHHCGSGTYQYPILHRLPMMTIGTDCRGRVDVALRLEEIGVNCHIPSPGECESFLTVFKNKLEGFLDKSGPLYKSIKEKLGVLKEKSELAMGSFDFEKLLVLRQASIVV